LLEYRKTVSVERLILETSFLT